MLFNNAISAAVGFVPIVGDVVLAAFKANSRNAALLEEFLRIRGEEFLKKESERVQNPADIKPGAGTEPGEHVPGKVEKKGSLGGWLRRRSTKGEQAGKGKSVDKSSQGTQTPPTSAVAASGTRFVENVPQTSDTPKK